MGRALLWLSPSALLSPARVPAVARSWTWRARPHDWADQVARLFRLADHSAFLRDHQLAVMGRMHSKGCAPITRASHPVSESFQHHLSAAALLKGMPACF